MCAGATCKSECGVQSKGVFCIKEAANAFGVKLENALGMCLATQPYSFILPPSTILMHLGYACKTDALASISASSFATLAVHTAFREDGMSCVSTSLANHTKLRAK